jgi:hypothetical protein
MATVKKPDRTGQKPVTPSGRGVVHEGRLTPRSQRDTDRSGGGSRVAASSGRAGADDWWGGLKADEKKRVATAVTHLGIFSPSQNDTRANYPLGNERLYSSDAKRQSVSSRASVSPPKPPKTTAAPNPGGKKTAEKAPPRGMTSKKGGR